MLGQLITTTKGDASDSGQYLLDLMKMECQWECKL